MPNQHQAVHNPSEHQPQKPAPVPEVLDSQAREVEQLDLTGAAGDPSLQAPAALLHDARFQMAQRREMAVQIGQVGGNQYLQRLVAQHAQTNHATELTVSQSSIQRQQVPAQAFTTTDPIDRFWNDTALRDVIADQQKSIADIYNYLHALGAFEQIMPAIAELQRMRALYFLGAATHPNYARIDQVLIGLGMPGLVGDPVAWQDNALGLLVQDAQSSVGDIVTYLRGVDANTRANDTRDLHEARRVYRQQSLRANAPDIAAERVTRSLDALLADVAQGQAPGAQSPSGGWERHPPAELLAGTNSLTRQQREQIREAIVPPVATDPSTGQALPFEPTVNGLDYGDRIQRSLENWIDLTYDSLVVGRGPSEHQTNVHPMARFEQIAAASKEAVDAVFGSYRRGPAFVAGRNLIDRFEALGREQRHMSRRQKIESAQSLLDYAMSSDPDIRNINEEHHATPEHREESRIIQPILRRLARTHWQRLLEIDRGWSGAQDPQRHRVELQRFRESDPGIDRRFMWYSFQMLMHEYLHSLTHPRYDRYARRIGGRGENTLTEGMTSVMTDVAWSNTEGSLTNQTLRDQVEGTPYAQEPFDASLVPPIAEHRYDSFNEAMNVVSIAGTQNVYAAYFLGRLEFIRAASPARSGSSQPASHAAGQNGSGISPDRMDGVD